MTTAEPPAQVHRWLVSEDSAGLFPIRTGTAATAAEAWTLALVAARAALLDGRISSFMIAVDDEIPTLGFWPGRDANGRLHVTHLLRELHRLEHDVLRDLRRAGTLTGP